MKKIYIGIYFLITILLISCSKDNKKNDSSNISIKEQITQRANSSEYTKELEKDLLSGQINKSTRIAENLQPTTELYTVINISSEEVYPYLDKLGRIGSNKSNRYNEIKNMVNEICQNGLYSLNNKFDKKYYYNFIMFCNDLKDKNEKYEYLINQNAKEKDIFKSYIIGEIFNNDELVQFPVRFFYDKTQLDVIIYMNTKNEIFQIVIT